jgi:CRP-like cAMP-binding protein
MQTRNELPVANDLLGAMPRQAYRRMQTSLESVELSYGQVLYEPMGSIRHVYFPIDCLVSLLTAVDQNRTLEVGMVGNEGMVGMPMALGIRVSAVRALVQGSGTALRMTAARFRTEFKNNLPLQRALFRYNHLLMAQISQTAACNRFHDAEHRLARWLLMTSDRLHADEFLLTHEFLGHMLGVRRVGVTKAAGALHLRKLIDYSRGKIRILDREVFES